MTNAAEPIEGSPRSSFGVLQRRVTFTIVGILVVLAGVSWWRTVGASRDMGSMVDGFVDVGHGMSMGVSAGVFLPMWVAMMVAMMFPTIAPVVLLHRLVVRRRGEGATSTVAFVAGYLAVWSAVGLVPLGVLIVFREMAEGSAWVARASGATVFVAGLYQFSRWKIACLDACRSPLSFLMTHDFGSGAPGAFKVGLSHGLHCLGCCWALMAVLFVVGLMNLAWMAAIAIVFLAEKNWRHGAGLTRLVGTAVTALGAIILIEPGILSTVA